MIIIANLLLLAVKGALTGTQDITVHHYIKTGNQQYMACGMPGADVDLSRVAAVNGLNKQSECGACLKVENTYRTSPQYVMALDIVRVGLDLNEDTFQKLRGKAATVVEEAAAVVEEAATVVEEAATVVEEAATVVEEAATVVEEAATVVEEAATVMEEAATALK
ncbi:hypothetical protein L0F63_000870 [Massospora cicadina]|nr:hypothetical protein L0F63_000870 [Massospora cicadina]